MVRLKCQECGAALEWDGSSYIVRCIYCGAEYLMHPRDNSSAKSDIFLGRGEVQGIPAVQGQDGSAAYLLESFAPKDWRIISSQASDLYYGDYIVNPYVAQAEYTAPDQSVKVVFRTANLYSDRKLSRIPLFKQIDVLGSYLRIGSFFTAEQYCDYLLQRDLSCLNARKLRVEEADAKELSRQKTIAEDGMRNGFSSIASDWKRVIYLILDQDRKEKIVAIETRVNDFHKMKQPSFGTGGFFGNLMGMAASAFDEHYWETQYECIHIADKDKYNESIPLVRKINETLKETETLKEIRQYMVNHMKNLQAQSAMVTHQQQMESWNRRSKIINDTHNYTMNVMREMNANTAATNQRVANLHSEAIRGVNTYYTNSSGYGSPDVVEASVKWDHVYQGTQNPDLFAATEKVWLEPGLDFEELKRTKGDY